MVAATSAGARRRVAMDTATITVNASGTVQAAGCSVSVAGQPDSGGPSTVTSTAPIAAPPPASTPAAAPRSVSPRHQMPSTSSGQKLDAATAKANPTTWDTSNPEMCRASAVGTPRR